MTKDQKLTKEFRTSDGRIISGHELANAFEKVADRKVKIAYAVRAENYWGSHVTEAQKDKRLAEDLAYAEITRSGEVRDFGTWQAVNEELTGECVPFLPPSK